MTTCNRLRTWLGKVSGFDRLFKRSNSIAAAFEEPPSDVKNFVLAAPAVAKPLPPAPGRYRVAEIPDGIRIAPVHFNSDGVTPRDPELYAAVQTYVKKQFGQELKLGYYARAHAAFVLGERGEMIVVGFMGIRNIVDVCTLHVTLPTTDEESRRWAERTMDAMFDRERTHLEDLNYVGEMVLLNLPEDLRSREWKERLVSRIGATPAGRYQFRV